MGAQLSTRTYKIANQKTVETKFDGACKEARYQYGHGGYTGTIAEFGAVGSWKDLLLPSANAAENYIDEHHEKWADAMAVSFKTEDGTFGWVVGGWVSE